MVANFSMKSCWPIASKNRSPELISVIVTLRLLDLIEALVIMVVLKVLDPMSSAATALSTRAEVALPSELVPASG